jgi:hypothetical protein
MRVSTALPLAENETVVRTVDRWMKNFVTWLGNQYTGTKLDSCRAKFTTPMDCWYYIAKRNM